jgi:hypothetical protein
MTMARTGHLISAVILFWANSAWAQQPPYEEEYPDAAKDEETPSGLASEERSVEAESVATPTNPAVTDEGPPPTTPPAPVVESAGRPVGFTVGIGAGYALPADIDQPNTAGVRFRLGGGLTFEPRVELETSQQKYEVGTSDAKDAVNTVSLITMVRVPFRSRGPFDFIFIGGALLEYVSQDPDGGDNNETDTEVALTWGLAIDYWLSSHWAFSFSAYNPLVSYVRNKQEIPGGSTQKSSTTSFGAIFDPTVVGMIHLFY